MVLAIVASAAAMANGQPEGAAVSSDAYPEKGISVIVTAKAGGGTDAMARAVCTPLSKRLGKSMVIINNGSASGLAGMTEISRANPDGYTLGVFSNTDVAHFVNTIEDVQFKTDDFTFIAALNATSDVLILSADSQFSNLEEMLSFAKMNPRTVTVALPTSIQHMSLQILNEAFGVEFAGIVYEGGGSVFSALVGSQVDAGILSAKFINQSKDQELNVLGIMLEERLETFPELPTFFEQGYKAVNAAARMLVGPAGLPEEVISTIKSQLDAGYESEIRESVLSINEAPAYKDYAEVNNFLDKDFSIRKSIYEQMASAQ